MCNIQLAFHTLLAFCFTLQGCTKLLTFLLAFVGTLILEINFDRIEGGNLYGISIFCGNWIWVYQFFTLIIFAWKWNEWMWPFKHFNWGRTEWSNVLIGIVLALVGGIFGILHTAYKFNNKVIEKEGMAGSIMILSCVAPLGFVWWQAKRLNPRGGEVSV
ncbi:Oidioi.mRNA.OKI2018_I69.chr2.g5022.t1.cds [Oikopleura dioica]|uniref:Oidioi.mRNA.OKI2018_I69.chr2.g5022.t1.cds n=1 Tax=Oikopleura dioica TaxID=34765 RepID=A0ABN7SYY0_OIKDI|nr:Oidioi.mRNA.OKI2018_I69.chr2.g5022.t1.cds [Oikopleura dioica]